MDEEDDIRDNVIYDFLLELHDLESQVEDLKRVLRELGVKEWEI